jgi:uncharacterized membrane protein YheB (UPF0754 family)
MNYLYIIIPLTSAFIGWFTNWVAIKMLFHPRLPKKILGLTFQGIFPKRQKAFAANLGKLVSNELLSFNDIANKITNPAALAAVSNQINTKFGEVLEVKVKELFPMASMFITDSTLEKIKNTFANEINSQLPQVMQGYISNLQNELDLEKIVVDKVSNFSTDKLEQIIVNIMSKELRFIEILGGILGFLIGVIQIILTILIK